VVNTTAASNAVAAQSRDMLVRLSADSCSSSPVHVSPDGHIASTAQPASPVFSTSLVAESSRDAIRHRSSSPPAHHSPVFSVHWRQSALFSPPTDMETDVSAIIGQAAEDSELWKSDVSFEVTMLMLMVIVIF